MSPTSKRTPAKKAAPGKARERSAPPPAKRPPYVVLGVLAAVVVLAIVAVVVASGGGDDDDADVSAGDGGPRATLAIAPIAVEGEALPEFIGGGGDDPAIGRELPVVQGTTPIGRSAIIGPAPDGVSPTLVAVVAHWCPHCNEEVPRLVELFESGELPDGTRFVALSTNAREDAPNHPPGPWLDGLGWPGQVVLDDEAASAAAALGTAGFPYLIVIDGEGRVVGRLAGEGTEEQVAELLEAATTG